MTEREQNDADAEMKAAGGQAHARDGTEVSVLKWRDQTFHDESPESGVLMRCSQREASFPLWCRPSFIYQHDITLLGEGSSVTVLGEGSSVTVARGPMNRSTLVASATACLNDDRTLAYVPMIVTTYVADNASNARRATIRSPSSPPQNHPDEPGTPSGCR